MIKGTLGTMITMWCVVVMVQWSRRAGKCFLFSHVFLGKRTKKNVNNQIQFHPPKKCFFLDIKSVFIRNIKLPHKIWCCLFWPQHFAYKLCAILYNVRTQLILLLHTHSFAQTYKKNIFKLEFECVHDNESINIYIVSPSHRRIRR